MFEDLLPPSIQRYAIPAFGVVAILMGLTGLIRRETGALSPVERSTPIGRILTPLLSGLWLITGLLFLISQLLANPLQTDIVGFTSLAATAIFLLVLLGALIASIFTRSRAAPAPAASQRLSQSAPRVARFQRLDAVTHPDHGYGKVLASYFSNGHETVAVRFSQEVHSVPAEALHLAEQQAIMAGASPVAMPSRSRPSVMPAQPLDPIQAQIDELERLLASLETQRATLGNQALEIGMKPLRDKLVTLIFAREEIDELERLLINLESQRETLGNEALEIQMKPLRDKLIALIFARDEIAFNSPPAFTGQMAFGRSLSEAYWHPAFPPGTSRVVASFGYDNMREGLTITREWYRNGEIFFRRTKPWDFARYGKSGTHQGFYIHDEAHGLWPGTYELRLYIDGVPQFDPHAGTEHRSFVIQESP